MLHIELRKQSYKGSRIDIRPRTEYEIPGLKDMISRNFIIENPILTFREMMNNGHYDGTSKKDVETEIDIVNKLSELWDNESSMNVMMLLSKTLQMFLNMKVREETIYAHFPLDPEEDLWEEADLEQMPSEWINQKKS